MNQLKLALVPVVLLCVAVGCGLDPMKVRNEISPDPGFSPSGLACDGNGRLFVADAASQGARVYVFTTDGELESEIAVENEIGVSLDVAIGPEGDIWISRDVAPKVVRLDENQQIEKVITHPRIIYPLSLEVDSLGVLWIIDSVSNEVFLADQDGAINAELGKTLAIKHPLDVAAAGSRMYLADTDNDRVLILDVKGRQILEWKTSGGKPLRIASQGDCVVVCQETAQAEKIIYELVRYTVEGKVVDRLNLELNSIDGLSIAPGGRVYVSSTQSHKILVIE